MIGYDEVPVANGENMDFFSVEGSDYRDSFLSYTVIVTGVALVAIVAVISRLAERHWLKRRIAMAVLAPAGACALSYLLFMGILGSAWFGYTPSLHYFIPTLLGCGVLSVVLFPRLSLRLRPEALESVPVIFCALVAAIFTGSTVARYEQAAHSGSILAFHKLADSDQYSAYCRYCLSPEVAGRIRELQSKTPSGQPILAVLSTPFLLDFRRNDVVYLEPCGLLAPWARVPERVRYVIWQQNASTNFGDLSRSLLNESEYSAMIDGPNLQDRTIGVRYLGFRKRLAELRAASKTIYEDDEFVIFQLDGPFKQDVQ